MGFETRVLAKVAQVLDSENSAYFYEGTMFAFCSIREAADLKDALAELVSCDILVSSVGKEFAFDFV